MMRLHKQYGFQRSYKVTTADAFASALRMRVCARRGVFALQFVASAKAPSKASFALFPADAPDLSFDKKVLAHPQLGLIFPKRSAKSAVLRNTLRRIARESFRHTRGQLPAGVWLVRLMGSLTHVPCSAAQKRLWRQQMDELWPLGVQFARDLSRSRER